LQGVDVWGRTLSESKKLIEQELAQHIRNGPKVSVNLRAVQSQRVWLLGRVQAPGVYPLNGPTTLLEALAGAGGTLSFVGQRDIPLSVVSEELASSAQSVSLDPCPILRT
jgi:polysaccharide export outer membrane protein